MARVTLRGVVCDRCHDVSVQKMSIQPKDHGIAIPPLVPEDVAVSDAVSVTLPEDCADCGDSVQARDQDFADSKKGG